MAYADLLSDDLARANSLIVVKPRRKVVNWVVHSGSVFVTDFTLGHVTALEADGVIKVQAASLAAILAQQFFYDPDLRKIYMHLDGPDPDTKTMVATYEMYFSTTPIYWHRVPTDSASATVYWDATVKRAPTLKASVSDALFGLLPVNSSQLTLSNAEHTLEPHLQESSFYQVDCDVYHWLGDLETANIRKLQNGLIGSFSYTQSEVTFQIRDRLQALETEYRPHRYGHQLAPASANFQDYYTDGNFPACDPYQLGRPIRVVYGVVDGFVPVNVSYVADQPLATDNRRWACCPSWHLSPVQHEVQTSVPASPASTTTRTYVGSTQGLRVGDMIRYAGASASVRITAVQSTTAPFYIEHLTNTTAAGSGDVVIRCAVGNVTVVVDGRSYFPLLGRDYNLKMFGANNEYFGFEFVAGMELALGMPRLITPNDRIFCRIYGKPLAYKVGGTTGWGVNDPETGTMAEGIPILHEILSNTGLQTTAIHVAALTSIQGTITDRVGFAVPANQGDNFPQNKDLIAQLLATLLVRMFLSGSNQWTFRLLGPLVGAPGKTVDDTEIKEDSFEYQFQYDDLASDLIVEYAYQQATVNDASGMGFTRQVSRQSVTAKYLHKIDRQKTFRTLHYLSNQAQTYAKRMAYIFGERQGRVSFQAKNRFFDTLIGDMIRVSRTRLPGVTFDGETEGTRDFAVLESEKSLRSVSISMDDQKGIQDNAGDW